MISETDLLWWCALDKSTALSDIKSVCDVGLQDLTCTRRADYDRISQMFVRLCGEPGVSLSECRTSAEMWRRLHREIVSLDIIGADPSMMSFDLNKDHVPPRLKEHFDFVTNVGTTEHVFNQANCFEVIHDLTKVGGVMAHAVPFAGFENHGFFRYTQKFFTRIAKANDYDCLDAWASIERANVVKQISSWFGRIAKTSRDHPVDPRDKPDVADFFSDRVNMFKSARSSTPHPIDFYKLKFDGYRSADACIYVFLRKTKALNFRSPTDLPDE